MATLRTTSLSLVLALALLPGGHDVSERCEALEKGLPELRELSGVPGFSVAVVSREGPVWSGAFGVRDQGTGAPVDGQTVFEAASLSKPVFAYAVLQLAEAELIDLDTPLVEYAPYRDIEHDPRHALLTARMALTHTTGLPNWRPRGSRLEFEYEPGERWRYSGEGFVMLQRVIEELVGGPLEAIARNLVFEPLEMNRSSYVWRERFAENVALPHDELGLSRQNTRYTSGNAAFSLLTTARDYARFLAAVMRGDNLEDETWAEMLRPQANVNTGVTWGLGWGLEENEDGLAFWHWGHNSGYRAYTIAYPARDFAFVYLSNSDHGMLLLDDLALLATGEGDHPSVLHLDYENHSSPRHVVPRRIERVVLDLGIEEGIATYFELKDEYPPEAFTESMLDQLAKRFRGTLRREEDALQLLSLNADVYPNSVTAQVSLAEAFQGLGRLDEALLALELASALDPSDEDVRRKLEAIEQAK
jgi:CubicO group peptidase (beta-lactamase class C family)